MAKPAPGEVQGGTGDFVGVIGGGAFSVAFDSDTTGVETLAGNIEFPGTDGELAQTGSDSAMITVLGVSAILLGLILVRSSRSLTQSILSRLRTNLGPGAIERTDHSYRLVAQPEAVDAVRVERMLAHASCLVADDPQTAAAVARDALALWRGTPFGDLCDVVFLEPEVTRLDALRLNAIEIRLEADVACGLLTSAIASLEEEIDENPYRERLWYQLILALARDGRRVEALRAVQRLRHVLAETGLKPSSEILELEQQVLEEAPPVHAHLHH